MKIAVLGAGNGGCAVAADLSLKGHLVTLIKTSNSMHNENFEYLSQSNGEIRLLEDGQVFSTNIFEVTRDLGKISDVELIIIYIQTGYHKELIKKISPYVKDGQIILINPGYLSTAYVLEYCSDKDISIVEATSSFIDCRIDEENENYGLIKVGFRNARNLVSVYPKLKLEDTKQKLESLQYNLHYMSTVEIALHNPNLIVHTVGAIMSIPRIEKTKGDYCMYWEVWTPSVWNILEKLDAEKMDVIEKLGGKRMPYVEACKFRNTLDDERDAKEIFFWYANMPTRAKGPVVVDSRYISEDVPEGLVMLEALGKHLNIATPICTSLIEIASVALGRDLRVQGRTTDKLGLGNIKKIVSDTIG
ncbi:NAD/NADP-dependent octopine/nopaline dehydrogenase family protein [Phocoenobacter atlanticus]|uniref:NAD/NADP-dependent octopine/nopaline dehydrogenase family protein n=1 Tax=Phocoenobacter atlanticus TaxID=3416742 RepID=UPI00274BB969|nr:NAD/NADP-dependent octopine/nopaline dehydrogenase family protein [Pasteurella atlantica]MDP8101768.1 NAD/NADP octopine/nopaline dehydrogenase family protein [Pasteurella atlantica]